MQSYLFHHQKRHGPLTLEQITGQLLPPDAVVWRQGLSGWVPRHEVPVLRDELPPADPDSTEVPVSAELLEASIVPAASAPATVNPLYDSGGRRRCRVPLDGPVSAVDEDSEYERRRVS